MSLANQGPETTAFVLALAVMGLGLIGAAIPLLPGTPIILCAAIGHRLIMGDAGAEWWVIGVLAVLMVVSLVLDFAATALGARKYGATWRGMIGALIGMLAGGAAMPPFGVLIGPIFGAALGEALGGMEMKRAIRAGLGTLFGLLLAGIARLAVGLLMVAVWAAHLIDRGALGR